MPTYEFRCPNGHVFDRRFSKISDAPSDVACPECGAEAHRQISGGAGLVFKGSGFYLTDYGKNAHRGSAPKSPDPKGGDAKPSAGTGSDGSAKPSSDSGASNAATKSESKSDKPSGGGSESSGKSKKPEGGSHT